MTTKWQAAEITRRANRVGGRPIDDLDVAIAAVGEREEEVRLEAIREAEVERRTNERLFAEESFAAYIEGVVAGRTDG